MALRGQFVHVHFLCKFPWRQVPEPRVRPGYEIGADIADGLTTCVYDIRGVFADGSEAEDYDLNLCDLGEYTFAD